MGFDQPGPLLALGKFIPTLYVAHFQPFQHIEVRI